MKSKKPSGVKIKLIACRLDESGYHIFVNVKLNGKRCRFLVDTGASHSVVDKAYFSKHFPSKKLIAIQQSATGLHSSVAETHLAKVTKLEINHFQVKNRIFAAIDLSHVNRTYAAVKKPKIHGIIGSDILMEKKMVIDYGSLLLLTNA